MESGKFDLMTRALARLNSRRATVRHLATGGAAALMVGLGLTPAAEQPAEAKKKKRHQCNNNGNCRKPRSSCKKAYCRNHKCHKKNLPDGTACENGLTCLNGQCGGGQCNNSNDCTGPLAGPCVNGFCEPVFTICTSSDSSVTFVSGPDSPPVGNGSAQFETGSPGETAFAHLRTGAFAGQALADLNTLTYATFSSSEEHCQAPEQEAPYLILRINFTGGTTVDDIILFEPHNMAPLACDVWQVWNAADSNSRYWSALTGDPNTTFTLSAYLTLHPDATLVDAATSDCPGGTGGFRLAVGEGNEWGNYTGNVNYLFVGFAGQEVQQFLF